MKFGLGLEQWSMVIFWGLAGGIALHCVGSELLEDTPDIAAWNGVVSFAKVFGRVAIGHYEIESPWTQDLWPIWRREFRVHC